MVFKIIENYKETGHPIIILSDEFGINIGFGVVKALLIKQHYKDIDKFIEKYSEPKESEE
ncbi:MAG: hypothetical protein KAJ44_00770 [Thermoplasmatales archaeon]|nr:hypothetical protein [Thermoplasmatales archaeon]